MRNLHEQKRITIPVLITLFMAILYAIAVTFLFANTFNPSFNLFGYGMNDFHQKLEPVDEYDIDDGEYMVHIPAGTRIVYKKTPVAKLKKNDIIVFLDKDDKNKEFLNLQVFIAAQIDEVEPTVYYTHDLDDMYAMNSYIISSNNFLGKMETSILKVGTIVKFVSEPAWQFYLILIGAALIMVGIPLVISIIQIARRRSGSPFPEGVNKAKLSTESLYIYLNIRDFLISAQMTMRPGYDCDLVYSHDILFAVLHYTNGTIYLNINKNFTRFDSRLDRSGYIAIPHASSLESAKKRINSMYKAYFADMVGRRVQRAQFRKSAKARQAQQRNRTR